MMKNKLRILIIVMLTIVITIGILIWISGKGTIVNKEDKRGQLQILTTFYPVYMIGLNLTENVEGLEVKSLTDVNTGCLHDYQLTTQDMRSVAEADVIIINGGGMEHFLEEILRSYPDVTIIDTSEGITMLPNEGLELHEEDGDEAHDDEEVGDGAHDHNDEFNAHIWLDPLLYIKQIENVRDGLKNYMISQQVDQTMLQALDENADHYIKQVEELDQELVQSLLPLSQMDNGKEIGQAVIFHNSFEYLANRIGLKVAFSVPLDSDTALNAKQISDIIEEVKAGNIQYLFTEAQYEDTIAQRIEAETDARVYIIDSAVTGDGSKDSYHKAMTYNIQILKEVLQ